MSAQSIVILCGAEGLSAEADERVRRMAAQDELTLHIERLASLGEWTRYIGKITDSVDALLLSPDVGQSTVGTDLPGLCRALADVSQRGVLLAEVHEDNIFRTNNELTPLQPVGCHVRLVCGLGAAGYLLAIESLLRAEGLQ